MIRVEKTKPDKGGRESCEKMSRSWIWASSYKFGPTIDGRGQNVYSLRLRRMRRSLRSRYKQPKDIANFAGSSEIVLDPPTYA